MDNELELRCLEMAVDQARRENATDFKETVAQLQKWFYTQVKELPNVKSGQVNLKSSPLRK